MPSDKRYFDAMKKLPPKALERARRLRKDMTDAERAIWRLLRG
jgi:very-short-patch-repair endonuclease